ncbi:P-loop NTPase fold protein, partial [Flavihumibacter sp. CACIAM 22H1]|uniref:KAP family P-loop NTPase fold protein n=1 Tax=Flavihumibacter sp. CACIAM 22H1 TaxID=1812911 RepID=UPI0007A7D56E
MWADNETSEDLLGFKIHADLLVDVINDDKVLPVTIGVFGDWGSGKSSILKIVEQELTGGAEDGFNDGTLVLYFNGWVFEGYDDAKAALLESIIERFDKHKTLGNKVKDKTAKLLKSVKWMRLLGLSFKKVIIPGAAAYLTGGASLLPFLVNEFSQLKTEDLAEKLKGDEAEDFLKDIIKKNEDEEVTVVREFRDDFKEMIDKSEIRKLVVIIDDLDRCTPERLIENLEAIKLFLNVEKTAFVIGADPRIVRHAIEHRYKTDSIENADDPNSRNKRIVSDYLEKLIQIPYYMPKLTDNEVETYLTLLFCKKAMGDDFSKVIAAFKANRENNRYDVFGLGDIQNLATEEQKKELIESISLIASLSSIITDGLKGNPRQIKRFLNTFTLRNRLVKVAKLPDFKIDILAKLMVLEYAS